MWGIFNYSALTSIVARMTSSGNVPPVATLSLPIEIRVGGVVGWVIVVFVVTLGRVSLPSHASKDVEYKPTVEVWYLTITPSVGTLTLDTNPTKGASLPNYKHRAPYRHQGNNGGGSCVPWSCFCWSFNLQVFGFPAVSI